MSKKLKKNEIKEGRRGTQNEKELQRHGKMSGVKMATRACSTFHADTACPPCKIKCVHGALCCDQNSQLVYDIFFSPISLPYQIGRYYTVYIAFNIGPYVVTLKRDKTSSVADIIIFGCKSRVIKNCTIAHDD